MNPIETKVEIRNKLKDAVTVLEALSDDKITDKPLHGPLLENK